MIAFKSILSLLLHTPNKQQKKKRKKKLLLFLLQKNQLMYKKEYFQKYIHKIFILYKIILKTEKTHKPIIKIQKMSH